MSASFRLAPGVQLGVWLRWDAVDEERVGRLAWHERRVLFEYDAAFLRRGLQISPLRLAAAPGVQHVPDAVVATLPGVFADSLPDGWGRLLLDRAARRAGVDPATLTPLDRLAHVGETGIGALVYRPELTAGTDDAPLDLDRIDAEVREVLEGSGAVFVDQLRALGGSPQGARPKALLQREERTGRLCDDRRDRGEGWRHWLVKFAGPDDPPDIGPLELAYARMAAACGVRTPKVRLLPSSRGPGFFASARFDRIGARRVHVATAAGLLDADHRIPSLDYEELARLTLRLCRDHREAEALVRLAAFNVAAHNRDDHAKQFSFVMDRAGCWTLSPAYDLTFASGPGGEHSTTLAGEGRAPGREQLARVAAAAGMPRAAAGEMWDRTIAVVQDWLRFADEAGVSDETARRVWRTLRR